MFKPKVITCVEECTTSSWQIQSFGYETALDAKIAAAKVFSVKQGALVKPHKGAWAVFFLSTPPMMRGGHCPPFGPEYDQ